MAATRKIMVETTATEDGFSEVVRVVNAVAVGGTKTAGAVPTVQEDLTVEWQGGGSSSASSGDMTKTVYDPANINGNAFDVDNHVESTSRKIMTADERTKLSGIAESADANVNPDWTAESGDAQILNKPTIGTVASQAADNVAITGGNITGTNLNTIVSALETGYSRRQAVIALATSTSAPPTEVEGDRYIIDNSGSPHADWDGASQNDIVEFDGTTWQATTPSEGWVAYSDNNNKDALFTNDGTPQWELRTVAVAAHNDTTGKQGGTTDEYYHLTQAQHTVATQAATASVNGYATATQIAKLSGIEASADVTDAANVAAAGAIMDGDFAANGLMKRTGAGSYAVATVTAAGEALLDDTDAAAQRTTLGLGSMATKAATEALGGMIETAADKTYILDQSAAYAYTINTLIIKSASGTCTAKLTIDGTDVTGISAVSVSSTEATGTASGANSVAVGATVALVISSNSDALDVAFTMKVTRA